MSYLLEFSQVTDYQSYLEIIDERKYFIGKGRYGEVLFNFF